MPGWGLLYYLLIFKEKSYVNAHLSDLASTTLIFKHQPLIVVDTTPLSVLQLYVVVISFTFKRSINEFKTY